MIVIIINSTIVVIIIKPSLIKKLPGIKVSDKLLSERLKIDCWRKRAPGVETAELCTK